MIGYPSLMPNTWTGRVPHVQGEISMNMRALKGRFGPFGENADAEGALLRRSVSLVAPSPSEFQNQVWRSALR